MSRYLDRNIQKNEKLIYEAELHWIIYYGGLVTTIMGGIFGPVATRAIHWLAPDWGRYVDGPVKWIAMAIIGMGALELIYAFIRQISTELVITNQRVVAKHGFIATTTFEVMLTKVEGANIDQTIMGRLLGYGTVMVKGTGGGISPIDHVANPYIFHKHLMETIKTMQQIGSSGPMDQHD